MGRNDIPIDSPRYPFKPQGANGDWTCAEGFAGEAPFKETVGSIKQLFGVNGSDSEKHVLDYIR